MNKLGQVATRIAILAEENPCKWSNGVMNEIGNGLELLISAKTKGGISMYELADYYHVSVRTLQRWRNDFADFPKPMDPDAKIQAFPLEDVMDWKKRHNELF